MKDKFQELDTIAGKEAAVLYLVDEMNRWVSQIENAIEQMKDDYELAETKVILAVEYLCILRKRFGLAMRQAEILGLKVAYSQAIQNVPNIENLKERLEIVSKQSFDKLLRCQRENIWNDQNQS